MSLVNKFELNGVCIEVDKLNLDFSMEPFEPDILEKTLVSKNE